MGFIEKNRCLANGDICLAEGYQVAYAAVIYANASNGIL